MEISNALTPVRGDIRYVKKLFNVQDMFDNTQNYLELGDSTEFEHFEIEYVFQLPISGRSQHGMISVAVLSPTTVEIANHTYEFPDSELEIETIDYTADVSAGSVRLGVAVTSIGENPTFNYRIAAIPAAV
jgi:hypothetical protein